MLSLIQSLNVKFAVSRQLSSHQMNQFLQIDPVFEVYSQSSTVLYSNFYWCRGLQLTK